MWLDIIQNSDEWFNLRLGKATSSNFGKIMANYGKAFGNPAIEYGQRIALEKVTGVRDETSSYSNAFMERGNELEPLAIDAYEQENFVEVLNGGFNDCGFLGDSPDGNIGNGCLEVKSVIPNVQWKRIKKGGYDTSYKWQIQGHLWLGEKEWCDFVSYCPEMPEKHRLYTFRVYPDLQMIEQMKVRLAEFEEEVNNNVKLIS
jgi:hypothetical protein